MIGGTDIVIRNTGWNPIEMLDSTVRAILRQWPSAIMQNHETGQRYENYQDVPFAQVYGLFVFRDEEAFADWEKIGSGPNNRNSMIHVMSDEDELTICVDDRDNAVVESIVSEISTARN